ncbi:TPA: hypothetical protein ACX3CX_004581 [Vibrio parahaemolyticus]
MDLDFYESFKYVNSVSVGKVLWADILDIECLDEITEEESIIPEGFDGAGEKLERVPLDEKRNELILGFSRLLVKYSKMDRSEENTSTISQIIQILSYLNSNEITHLKFDI